MNRLSVIFALVVGGCGEPRALKPCEQVPTPEACLQPCDPSPSAPATCAAGYHCSPDGRCDAQCVVGGTQCGGGYVCTADGRCESSDDNKVDAAPQDTACASVHFTPTRVTPSIQLLLDRSWSMGDPIPGAPPNERVGGYKTLRAALTGPTGAVTAAQANVYFGAALYAGDQLPCLNFAGYTAPRALNNAAAIDALIASHTPDGHTPTGKAVELVTADFVAHPPPANSSPIILLATDGLPTDGNPANACGADVKDNGPSIAAVTAAYTAGIRTFIIGLADLNPQFLQDIANVGAGKASGSAPNCPTCEPFYTANDTTSLTNALNSIISGVISCDLEISGKVDPAAANTGTVKLNGTALVYGTDWTVDANGKTIHLLGAACRTLRTSPGATVDAEFPCGVVLL